jgi:hypothetical protein
MTHIAALPQTVVGVSPKLYVAGDEVRHGGLRRNAMQQFIAKFEKAILGLL